MFKGTLILTSDGLTNQNIVNELVKAVKNKPTNKEVAIVTTASKLKSLNPYSRKARKQYWEMGFKRVTFVDLEKQPFIDFSDFSVIHVCGGNTFKLLYFARRANFKKTIEDLLGRDDVYVGVSAGTAILMSSIHFIEEYHLDPNKIRMKDFTGFNMVPNIFVHYAKDYEHVVGGYEKKYKTSFQRIANDQAMIIRANKSRIVSG